MKKRLLIILSIAGAVVAVAGIAAGLIAYNGAKLDRESKAYTDTAIPAIAAQWDIYRLMQDASPELLAAIEKSQGAGKISLGDLFKLFSERLGKLKRYDGANGQATMRYEPGKGKTVSAEYKARGVFEKGAATIDVGLLKRDGAWKIASFHVNSPSLLQAPAPQPAQAPQPAKAEQPGRAPEPKRPAPPDAKQQAQPATAVAVGVYEYNPKGKRDPFMTLIVKSEPERKKGFTPVENYDVVEFRLIAVLWDNAQYYAVITLPDGKSYTIKEGTKLGLHGGKVFRITKSSVVIREQLRDQRGTVKPKDTILKLRREEEG